MMAAAMAKRVCAPSLPPPCPCGSWLLVVFMRMGCVFSMLCWNSLHGFRSWLVVKCGETVTLSSKYIKFH
jgi:hypothetical protein